MSSLPIQTGNHMMFCGVEYVEMRFKHWWFRHLKSGEILTTEYRSIDILTYW